MSGAAERADAGAAGWEHFPHDADVGLRGFGPDPATAFEQAALALTAAVCDPGTVTPRAAVAIACEAPERDLLLVEWLNAVIYEMAVRRMVFSRFSVVIDDGHLTGKAWGEPVDRQRHCPAAEPKGATYTALKVAPLPQGGWIAQCVVDV